MSKREKQLAVVRIGELTYWTTCLSQQLREANLLLDKNQPVPEKDRKLITYYLRQISQWIGSHTSINEFWEKLEENDEKRR